MPEIVWKRGAEEDLMSIFADLEDRREGAGEVFTRMLDGTLQGLRGHPQMAPVFEPPMRRLVAGNSGYGIFYTVEARGIIVHALMQALDEAIKAYEPVATAPREATVIGKGVTGNIETDIKTTDALLKQELDKAMRKFKRKKPDFAEAYANARIIVDLGGGQQPPAPPQTPKP